MGGSRGRGDCRALGWGQWGLVLWEGKAGPHLPSIPQSSLGDPRAALDGLVPAFLSESFCSWG